MNNPKRPIVFMMLALLLVTSCSETSSPGTNNKGSTNSPVNTLSDTGTNLGPTGATDPVDGNNVNDNDITYYDQADPSDDPVLPGTVLNACGSLYKQFNNPVIFFKNENNQLFNVQEFSYDSVTFLRNIKFTNDSFNVCLEGYQNGANYFLNKVVSQTATSNPLKTQTGNYAHEICGNLAYITNYSGQTTLNLKVNNIYYLIKLANQELMLPAGIPTTTTTLTTANTIEACLYSNSPSYYNYNESFKPQFEIENFDFGALNPAE
ncbi:MAG: hypothetical protein K9K67_13110 [Bacteriovoracaceae bacterium]|nr:hypothetical protein [Bacteriovoracaceae bacterium]